MPLKYLPKIGKIHIKSKEGWDEVGHKVTHIFKNVLIIFYRENIIIIHESVSKCHKSEMEWEKRKKYFFWDEGNKERKKIEESIVVNIVNLSWLIIFSRQGKGKK